jgi:hypothetical protein
VQRYRAEISRMLEVCLKEYNPNLKHGLLQKSLNYHNLQWRAPLYKVGWSKGYPEGTKHYIYVCARVRACMHACKTWRCHPFGCS